MSKKTTISTDLFRGKEVPPFIKDHDLFQNPIQVKKVFPSIGLPNFKEAANIDKCLVDVKREGSYVFNLLKVMADQLAITRDAIALRADRLQYLESKTDRETMRAKLNDIYSFSNVLSTLSSCIDPYNRESLNGTIQTSEGKVSLKLIKDIVDSNGKRVFRKDESLFGIFNKVNEKCTSFEVPFVALERTDVFKIFSKENIPNKEFSIIFSSEGNDGAWDIITMSMRGIKSCQRWDGEYPRCLIGSIFSKFVGVMYLTSGVAADGIAGYNNLGSKMMRRCVVRYAVDADEDKPCILIDKMYPELDKDVLDIFVKAIQSRTKLPVYYAQDLGNKLRHIYIPSEQMREKIIAREWSYQDTPLKSKNDLNVYLLNYSKDEVEREVKGFNINLALFIARRMEEVYSDYASVDVEIKKTIKNIRMNTSFTPFCESLAGHILNAFRAPPSKNYTNSKVFYRKYLMEFLLKRKQVMTTCQANLKTLITTNTSRTLDIAKFTDYIFTVVAEFAKLEVKKLIN